MTIDVEMFGQLSPGMERRHTLALERPMVVEEVAAMLGLNPEDVGLIAINGVQSEMEDPVPPGCRLCFFPFLTGG